MPAAERLDGSRRVHVGNGNNPFAGHPIEVVPACFDLVDFRHIRHRAAGTEVRQDDLLLIRAEDIRALRHEMNATENDEFRVLLLASPGCKLEGIASKVGKSDHFVSLVVVTKNNKTTPKAGTNGTDTLVRFGVRQLTEAFG